MAYDYVSGKCREAAGARSFAPTIFNGLDFGNANATFGNANATITPPTTNANATPLLINKFPHGHRKKFDC